MTEIKIVAGRSNPDLARMIAKGASMRLAKLDLRNFKDGEIWAKDAENVRGVDLFIVKQQTRRRKI